jgi:hypothetical protein
MEFRVPFATKADKMMMIGKGVTAETYEAELILEDAAAQMAKEDAETAVSEIKAAFLYESVTRTLQKELDETKSKLMHHTSARELLLTEKIRELEKERDMLQSRIHWESMYGIFLPGSFLLAEDGECECRAERRLYGDYGDDTDRKGGGAARKSRSYRRGPSGRFVRTCSCGREH